MPHSTCTALGCDAALWAARRPKKYCDRHNPHIPKPGARIKMPADKCHHCGKDISHRAVGVIYCDPNCNSMAGYYRRRVLSPRDPKPVVICSIEACERTATSRGMCTMHYKRWARANGMNKAPSDKWSDVRRSNSHARRARMNGATTGDRVLLAQLLERDGAICSMCNGYIDIDLPWPEPWSVSVDHTIPLARGGQHTMANATVMHLRCNLQKGVKILT